MKLFEPDYNVELHIDDENKLNEQAENEFELDDVFDAVVFVPNEFIMLDLTNSNIFFVSSNSFYFDSCMSIMKSSLAVYETSCSMRMSCFFRK